LSPPATLPSDRTWIVSKRGPDRVERNPGVTPSPVPDFDLPLGEIYARVRMD